MGGLIQLGNEGTFDSLRRDFAGKIQKSDVKVKEKSEKIVKDAETAVVKTIKDARVCIRGIKLNQI